jgi:hypothetical protein
VAGHISLQGAQLLPFAEYQRMGRRFISGSRIIYIIGLLPGQYSNFFSFNAHIWEYGFDDFFD